MIYTNNKKSNQNKMPESPTSTSCKCGRTTSLYMCVGNKECGMYCYDHVKGIMINKSMVYMCHKCYYDKNKCVLL